MRSIVLAIEGKLIEYHGDPTRINFKYLLVNVISKLLKIAIEFVDLPEKERVI